MDLTFPLRAQVNSELEISRGFFELALQRKMQSIFLKKLRSTYCWHYFNLPEQSLMNEGNTLENGNHDQRRKRLVHHTTPKSNKKTKHNPHLLQSPTNNRTSKLHSRSFSKKNQPSQRTRCLNHSSYRRRHHRRNILQNELPA